MTKRTKTAYLTLLHQVKKAEEQLTEHIPFPTHFAKYFETAAFQSEFPVASHAGSLFHFAQILWRKLQHCGLQFIYSERQNSALRLDFYCIIALAFVLEQDVILVLNDLVKYCSPQLDKLCEHAQDYFFLGHQLCEKMTTYLPHCILELLCQSFGGPTQDERFSGRAELQARHVD